MQALLPCKFLARLFFQKEFFSYWKKKILVPRKNILAIKKRKKDL